MVIVSQDKEEIVNFDKVESIWICSDEEGRFTIEATADTNSTLGYYETKERAKEVLQEIVKKYSSYLELKGGLALIQGQMNVQPNIFNIPKVYEMPES